MGLFDALEDLLKGRGQRPSSRSRAKTVITTITAEDLQKYARHKDQDKSIFNPRNTTRVVHYKMERVYLLDRDGRACGYCGGSSQEKPLQPDHIIPYKHLPVTHMDNLVMTCPDCNSGKSDAILTRATLLDVLLMVYERNEAHFPRKKFKAYRRQYAKILDERLRG